MRAILGGLIEVFGVGVADPRLVAGLTREPEEERLVRPKNAADRRLRKRLVSRRTDVLVQLLLEGAWLLDVKPLKGFVDHASLEAQDGLRRSLNRAFIGAFRFPEIGKIYDTSGAIGVSRTA